MLEAIFGDIDPEPTRKQFFNSCADDMEMCFVSRKEFVGLKNQGATCYLNSFFQLMFMIPEVKNLMTKLDISALKAKNQNSWQILEAFQILFLRMKYLDNQNQDIQLMNQAFGWEGAEHLQQHDIQEAMRIIFEEIVIGLEGLPQQQEFERLLKGRIENYVICQNCKNKNTRDEDFYDLFVNVKTFEQIFLGSLEESINFNTQQEKLDGDNKYFCKTCDSKQNALKGMIYKELPSYTFFYVNRFEFDLDTFQRIKVKSQFQYPFEIDMSPFVEQEGNTGDLVYEITGVIVHRGNPYGGHYFLVCKDLLNEANHQEGPGFYEINDTIIKRVDQDVLKKFYSSNECGYILVYRKKNLELENSPVLQENNEYYQEIMKKNEEIRRYNEEYEEMKNTIQVQVGSLRNLIERGILFKENLQRVVEWDEKELSLQKINKNNIKSFRRLFDEDIEALDFYSAELQKGSHSKIYFKRKFTFKSLLDLKDEYPIGHKEILLYIKNTDESLKGSFFLNFQELNPPINIKIFKGNQHFILLANKFSSLEEITHLFNSSQSANIESDQLHLVNIYGEIYNLEQYSKKKLLREILCDNIELKVMEELDPNKIYFIVKHENIYSSFELTKELTLTDLQKKCEEQFSLAKNSFVLVDEENQIIESSSHELNFSKKNMNLEIREKTEDIRMKKIRIYFLDQENQEKSLQNCEEMTVQKLPSKCELVDLIKTKREVKELVFFTSTMFEEPSRRISFDRMTLTDFEISTNDFLMFVKIDGGFLNQEMIDLFIFRANKYPLELEKLEKFNVYINWSLKEALNYLILNLVQKNIFQDFAVEKYDFQVFNKGTQFQMPGQYLDITSNIQVKKVFSSNKKLLVKYNESREVKKILKLVVFIGIWHEQSESYTDYTEYLINPGFKKLNKNNSNKFKQEIKEVIGEKEDILVLLLNYKTNRHDPLDERNIFLNDGQQIGVVKNWGAQSDGKSFQDKNLVSFIEKPKDTLFSGFEDIKTHQVKEVGFNIKKKNEKLENN